ncbi:MAG TPA: hypothetical protein DEV81_05355 [Cyanobacteria bacterium UBA11049]|nr:hypothetical protein [Cyanobacteria bacterium UBA11049]
MIEFVVKLGENAKELPKENLSLCISLLAVVATWGNFWNSRRTFASANYPKLRAELKLLDKQALPIYSLFNESDKISANDINITISIARLDKLYFERDRWLTYEYVELERLKPQESFPPSYIDSNTSKWYKSELLSQKPFPKISPANSYDVRLTVKYTSNVFGANKICTISKKYRLVSCHNSEAAPKYELFWQLQRKNRIVYQK